MAYTTQWQKERRKPGWQSLIQEFGENLVERMYGYMPPRASEYITKQAGSISPDVLSQTREWATGHPVLGPLMGTAQPSPTAPAPSSPATGQRAAPQPGVAVLGPTPRTPPNLDPGRGSMEFLLRQVGVGGPQADLSKITDMESVIFLGMGWGFSREEVQTQLAGKTGGIGAPAEAAAWLIQQYAEQYGGMPPRTTGKEGYRYPAYAWRQTPGGRQARARAELAGYQPGMEYEPGEWEYPYVRRQGQAVPWSIEAVTGTYPGIPGEKPGTYMTRRAADEPGQLKMAKDIQRGAVYPEIELRRGQESLMERMAFQMGPLSERRERGAQVPMALLGEEWLPEGVMILPKDYYTTGAFRFSKDIFLPKGFTPEMVPEGTTWTHGKIQPFTGAAPLDMGLGRAWSAATLHSYSLAPGKQWNKKTQKWEEGQFLRMGFEVEATPEMLRLSSKTLGAKYMAPMGEAARIHGLEGYGISEIKDPTMLPVMYWAHRPEEAAKALSEMRGETITPEQLEQMNWASVGRELTTYFRENILKPKEEGGIYEERALTFDVHREMLRMLPQGRFGATDIEGQPEMVRITTEPVPMLVGEWPMMGRRGYSVKQPNLPFREMQMIEDVAGAAGDPGLLWEIRAQAGPTKKIYSELMNAVMASEVKGYAYPQSYGGRPIAIEEKAARGVVARSQLAFEEKYGGKLPTDIPEGLMILNRMVMEEAEETWGSSISLGESGVLASPKVAGYFSAPGIMEASTVTGYVSAYAAAIRATAEGTEEERAAAYERVISKQSELAGGRNVLRKTMAYNVPRAIGEVVYPETALGATEVTMPEKRILQAYSVPREEREAFIARWKAGKLTPTAMIWGHPTTGREMFARQVSVIHPDIIAERGGMLGKETPFRASPMLAEMLGRDFDEDYLWALMTGHLTGSGQALGIQSPGIPMATAEWVQSQSQMVQELGRGSLAFGGELKRPPGVTEEAWGEMGGLERFKASITPDYLREVGPKEQFAAQRALASRQKAIGVRYNLLEDIIATAATSSGVESAEHFHLAVHGRGQTPAILTPQLEKIMNYIESFGAEKGGMYLPFAEPKEEGGLGAPAGAGGKGAFGLMSGLMRAGLGAVAEGTVEPELFGQLFYPEGRAEEGAGLARRWAKAPGGSRARREMASEYAEIDPEEWIRTSTIGTVGGAHMMERAQRKGQMTRLSAETEEYLGPWKDRYAMMRAYRSKRADIPLENRIRAAITLYPEQEVWFGSFGMMTELEGYQAGTFSSRAGQALVGEEGPEVVDLPEGSVVHPATSTESLDAAAERAVATGQLRQFQGGGEIPEDLGGFLGEELGGGETPPNWPEYTGARQQTFASQQGQQGARVSYPPRVSRERFYQSLSLWTEFIDEWAEQIKIAGGLTAEHNDDLAALTKQIVGWKKDIESGLEFQQFGAGWKGKEMQRALMQAQALQEPSAPGVPGYWWMAGEVQTEQKRAVARGQLERLRAGGVPEGGGLFAPPGGGMAGWVPGGEEGWFGGKGPTAGSERAFRYLTSYWNLFRMERIWGMTGGYALGQIPAAIGQEQAAAGAAAAYTAPLEGGAISPTALQMMAYQQGQRGFQADIGRAAYQAWGWTQQGVTGRALGTAAGIGLPAVGYGAILGLGAQAMFGVTAMSVAAPAAGLLALEATRRYMQGVTEPGIPANQVAAYRQWEAAQGVGPTAGERFWEPEAMVARAGLGARATWGWLRGAPLEPERAAGGEITRAPLSALAPAERAARMLDIGERYGEGEGPYKAYGPEAVTGLLGQWAGLTSGIEQPEAQILEDPRRRRIFEMMLERGLQPSQFAQRAQQLNLAPAQWEQIAELQGAIAPPIAAEREAVGQQWLELGFQRFGIEPGDIYERAMQGGLPRQTQMEIFEQERLLRGSQYAWTQAGMEQGIPEYQTVHPQTGMGIGTQWGSRILAGRILGGETGLQRGAELGVAGGGGQAVGMDITVNADRAFVNVGGQQVEMTQWALEDWARTEQQGERRWTQEQAWGQFNLQQAYTMGIGQFEGRGVWDFQDRQRQMQYAQQMQQFGFQQEGLNLNYGQFMERWQMGQQQFQWQTQYQRQGMGIQYGRQQVQFGWAEEDLAFRGAQAGLQYGWQMEDIEERMRYSTGRERRQLMQQRERATISYGMGMGRLETEEGRLDTRRQWAEEDFERARDYFERRVQWTQQEMDMSRRHFEERHDLSQRELDASKTYFQETFEFQGERIEAEREYWTEQSKFQKTQLEHADEQIGKWEDYEEAVNATNKAITLQNAQWNAMLDAGGPVRRVYTSIVGLFDYIERRVDAITGNYVQGNPYGVIGGR